MRVLALMLAAVQLSSLAAAHSFVFIAHAHKNHPVTDVFWHIRKHLKKQIAYPWYMYTNLEDMRCNTLENNSSWPDVETLTLDAGTTIGVGVIDWLIEDFRYIWHPGPAQAYLSRAPNDNLTSYLGDGDWFKIGQYSYANKSHWVIDGCDTSTPPGKYLLRVEHLFNDYAGTANTQFYHSCAHVEVVGRGGGTPGATIKLPEDYIKDAGLDFTVEQAYSTWGERNYTGYRNSGPPVWTG
ncbi:glycosyl hydrolase family 61-domain-containing protein [Lophiotrema nucula]|uniref:AA9 family lytic polysaccharide monooxygenase n=1 Tax=Lophiotrema nucula TaxID=690887 RepID=A0A6A5YRC2_9PLEO|nr:glycosyl hydrolase family 61-domain-containing protein [Lophiotrema nucula]